MKMRLEEVVEHSNCLLMQVGDSLRVEHVGCGKGNASVTRTPVGWLMHCFKCDARGLRVATHANPAYNASSSPAMPISVSKLEQEPAGSPDHEKHLNRLGLHGYEATAYGLVVTLKTMMPRVWFPLQSIVVDKDDGKTRIVYNDWMAGKATATGGRKWDIVGGKHEKGELVYIPRLAYLDMLKAPPNSIVLVEDPISALKINEALPNHTGIVPISMLGLHIGPLLLESLGNFNGPVILWADGDPPGIHRGKKLVEQLRFIRGDRPNLFHFLPTSDPKDLTPKEIGRELDRLLEKASHGSADVEEVSSAHT